MEKFKMKHLKKMVEDELENALNNLDFHIVVIAEQKDSVLFDMITEGKWNPSGEKDYWYRKDVPKFDWQQLHTHIARKKHINTKSQQVSWNHDGSRHDQHTFNTNFTGMEIAKGIARRVMNLPDNFKLESYSETTKGTLIVEGIENHPEGNKVFVFFLRNEDESRLLKG